MKSTKKQQKTTKFLAANTKYGYKIVLLKHNNNQTYTVAYMWTLPDHQGGSLKWALKFLLKHTTFYQNLEISLIRIKNFPIYSIHFL